MVLVGVLVLLFIVAVAISETDWLRRVRARWGGPMDRSPGDAIDSIRWSGDYGGGGGGDCGGGGGDGGGSC